MYLEKLRLKNFRCFEDLEIDFHRQLTVIVGTNGSGKTSILEGAAIAIGSFFAGFNELATIGIDKKGDPLRKSFAVGSTDDVQMQYPVEVSAYGKLFDDEDEISWKRCLNRAGGTTTTKDAKQIVDRSIECQKALSNGNTSLALPVIAYYGTGRLWDYHRHKKGKAFTSSTRTNGYIDSLDGTANVKLMLEWFRNMTIKKYQRQEENMPAPHELDAVYASMEKCLLLLSGHKDINIKYNLNTNELDVYYTEADKTRMRIPLNQLSDGYKGMVSLVADIAYRMATLNPQLNQDILQKSEGVVLIDEIDLHLHPAWQQKALENLMEIFPKVQFIVSTHAPAVINSVKSENLRVLENFRIDTVSNQVYGKDVKSVLNEIMGVTERPLKVSGLFEEFYKKLSEKDFSEAERILDIIDELREYHDPEAAGCRVKLKLERLRGDKNDRN